MNTDDGVPLRPGSHSYLIGRLNGAERLMYYWCSASASECTT